VLLALAERPLCVGDLAELCRASQSAMSHQLRTLRDAGLVKAHRRGKQIFYALDDRHVAHLIAGALAHVGERRSRRGAERGD
jgi:ArsR family transcriptional regulator, lead/cadmium/zinc/bismuth-responsive transcriptional repressor